VNEIIITKDYNNEILNLETISIWIIYIKNMLGILGTSIFV
jgi:hypothetical protein